MNSEFAPTVFELPEEPAATFDLSDALATRRLGGALASVLDAGDFVGLVGPLGAGKTTMMQGLVGRLDPHEDALSPTYTLLNEYPTRPPVFHFDLYRLENVHDLETVGYWDYVESGAGVACVEWVDRIPAAWPGEGWLVELQRVDGQRRARVWAPPGRAEEVADLNREFSS